MKLTKADEYTISLGQARVQGVVTANGMIGWVLPGKRFTDCKKRAQEVALVISNLLSRP